MLYFIEKLDIFIAGFVSSFLNTPFLDDVMVFVTHLADSGAVWIVTGALLLCFKKTRRCGFVMLLSLLCAFLISEYVIKPIFMRPRPFEVLENIRLIIPRPSGASFPSSHTTTSFASAMVLFKFDKSYGIYALILAFFIAISRVYLGVHFFTDILIGALLGTVIGFISYKLGGFKK